MQLLMTLLVSVTGDGVLSGVRTQVICPKPRPIRELGGALRQATGPGRAVFCATVCQIVPHGRFWDSVAW